MIGVFILTGISIYAQDKISIADSIIDRRGEVYVSIPRNTYKSVKNFDFQSRIDKFTADSIFLYLGKDDRAFISMAGEDIHILSAPSELHSATMSDSPDDVLQGIAYPDYRTYLNIMKSFGENWPEICKIDTIGYSEKGRLILSARIGKRLNAPGEVPLVFYSSSIHGDELTGFSLMLRLIDLILNPLSNNSIGTMEDEEIRNEITDLISGLTIIINPLANPDGTYFRSDTTVFGATRNNANGIDLNRNYPDAVKGNHPDSKSWQKETIAMMAYMEKHSAVLSANFHGGAEVVNYPFDVWSALHADNNWFRFIAREYADSCQARKKGYMKGYNDGISNGYAWYKVSGSRQDYVCYFLHGRELTIELSDIKLPPSGMLNEYWEANKRSMLNLIKQANYGIQGIVRDSMTDSSIDAMVFINNHDKLNSDIKTLRSGHFFRPIYSGNYEMTISSDGYQPLTLSGVSIENYEKLVLSVKLLKTESYYEQPEIEISPNPFYDRLILELTNPTSPIYDVEIYNLNGLRVYHKKFITITDIGEFELFPNLKSAGLYILKITDSGDIYTFKIVYIK